MAMFIKFVSKLLGVERPISVAVKSIEEIFDSTYEQQLFFDLVIARFEYYDEFNKIHRNEYFLADIEFISYCITISLSTSEHQKLFSQRVDAYFYMYRRLIEYIHWAHRSERQIEDVQRQFHQQLRITFESTKGQEPNLCIKDKNLAQRMNIQQHLSWIKEINDIETLHLFFVLCKLSFQSSFIVNDRDHLRWIDIFSKMNRCYLSFGTIISEYINFKQAFEPFPLDITALIHLIQQIYRPKGNQQSPFDDFINITNQLGFEHKIFFQQFHPAFAENLKKKLYGYIHINGLLHLLSKQDERLFTMYSTTYSSTINNDVLWNTLLFFIKNGDINEIIQKQFGTILVQRLQTISVENFQGYYKSINEILKLDNAEPRPLTLKLFEYIFQEFLLRQLTDDQYSYRLHEKNLKPLLNIAQELSSAIDFQRPSYYLVIRHLLFTLDKTVTKKYYKIRCLFSRIDRLSSEEWFRIIDPSSIIRDDWLNDHIFDLPGQWLEMKKDDYKLICDAHRNNRWSIHIWSKIIYWTFKRSESSKSNEILSSMNQWMADVEHDTYNANDTLTIIFVKHVFELMIVKHMNSLTSLSNINVIIQYVLCLRQEAPDSIDSKLVDDFVENAKQSIKEILLLNGKISENGNDEISITSVSRHPCDVSSILGSINGLSFSA